MGTVGTFNGVSRWGSRGLGCGVGLKGAGRGCSRPEDCLDFGIS